MSHQESIASQNETVYLEPRSPGAQLLQEISSLGRRALSRRALEGSKPTRDLLANLRVAAPCSEDWNLMKGDARVRDCGSCQMKVFNLSEMSAEEARALIQRSLQGERICARFYRRSDGKVMTRDCGPGRTRLQRMRIKFAVSALAIWAGCWSWLAGTSAQAQNRRSGGADLHLLTGKIAVPQSEQAEAEEPAVLMGEIAEVPRVPPTETPRPRGAGWAPWNTEPSPNPIVQPPIVLPVDPPTGSTETPHHEREEPFQFVENPQETSDTGEQN